MKIKGTSIIGFIIIFSFLSSCTSTRYITQTKRSGVEQLLITRAIDRSLAKIENLHVNGSRVFIDITSLATDEAVYLKGALTQWFLENGATVVDKREKADLIASVLVKCVGTDRIEAGLSIPSLPVPFTGIFTPKVNILTIDRQKGYSEMDIIIYSAKTGKFKQKVDSLIGKARFDIFTILLIPVPSSNIY